MSYTPPDAHNVILDFEQPITPLDSHNLVLNFGDVEPQLIVLNAVIDTRIQAFIQGSNTEIVINHGDLLATINTNIQAEINGTNWENVDNRGTLLVVVDTSIIQARVSGINHINHIRGIEAYWITEYQRAKPCLIAPEIQWAKPIFKAHKSAFYFEHSLTFGNQVFVGFDKANTLHRAVQIIHEQTTVLSRICQAELDRVNSSIQLNWQLIDELSWILPMNSLSYSNLTPIAAIKLIVESAGGFIYSEKNSNTLTVKPKYKKTFWDSIAIADYDRLIPMSLTKDQSTDYELYPDYNGITLSNDQTGLTGQVKRTGTSADTLLETVNSPLFTVESMGAYT